jgi:hypothetical protein
VPSSQVVGTQFKSNVGENAKVIQAFVAGYQNSAVGFLYTGVSPIVLANKTAQISITFPTVLSVSQFTYINYVIIKDDPLIKV